MRIILNMLFTCQTSQAALKELKWTNRSMIQDDELHRDQIVENSEQLK